MFNVVLICISMHYICILVNSTRNFILDLHSLVDSRVWYGGMLSAVKLNYQNELSNYDNKRLNCQFLERCT